MQLIIENTNGNAKVHLDVLKAICGDTKGKSMIDLGSGNAPQTRLLGFEHKVYIDIIERDLHKENEFFLQTNIIELVKTQFDVKVDVCICLDCIEHFWEDDGRKIIKWMEENSDKQIIFTPQGRYMNVDDENNTDPDTHKYSWTDKQFQGMGWATITFPKYHPCLGEGGLGAFFAFHCDDLTNEFYRVSNELKLKNG